MDMKRFDKTTGLEAITKLVNGERLFKKDGGIYRMDNGSMVRCFGETETGPALMTFNDVFHETWYIKKPFDVRAAMLARPNEWVGAYKDERGNWCKVKLNSEKMMAQDTVMTFKATVFQTAEDELDVCIPIEDVPKEEI